MLYYALKPQWNLVNTGTKGTHRSVCIIWRNVTLGQLVIVSHYNCALVVNRIAQYYLFKIVGNSATSLCTDNFMQFRHWSENIEMSGKIFLSIHLWHLGRKVDIQWQQECSGMKCSWSYIGKTGHLKTLESCHSAKIVYADNNSCLLPSQYRIPLNKHWLCYC